MATKDSGVGRRILRIIVLGAAILLLLNIFQDAANGNHGFFGDAFLGLKIVIEVLLAIWVLVLSYKIKRG